MEVKLIFNGSNIVLFTLTSNTHIYKGSGLMLRDIKEQEVNLTNGHPVEMNEAVTLQFVLKKYEPSQLNVFNANGNFVRSIVFDETNNFELSGSLNIESKIIL